MDKEPGMIDPTDETLDLKRRIHVQTCILPASSKPRISKTRSGTCRKLHSLQALATVNQTQVLEHGLHRLFDVLKLKASRRDQRAG